MKIFLLLIDFLSIILLLTFSIFVHADTLNVASNIRNNFLPKIIFLNQEKDWEKAFIQLSQMMKNEYALGKHKKINWEQLQYKYSSVIAEAQRNKNKLIYYQALRNYIFELHDAHSFVFSDPNDQPTVKFISDLVKLHTEGSYGLIITKTNDSHYIVSYVEPNSSASNAGILAGDEILIWNNKSIAQAVKDADILWNDENELLFSGTSYVPSTQTGIEYEKIRMLVRDKIGTHINITWQSPGKTVSHAILSAIDDHYFIAKKTALYQGGNDSDPRKQIIVKWLPDNYVELKLGLNDGDYCDPSRNEKESPLYLYFIKIMQEIINKNPKGIIIDLRGHQGGDGRLALDYAGYFTSVPDSLFYIKMKFYNTVTHDYRSISDTGPYWGEAGIHVNLQHKKIL
jgi:C-terminal processing protease CtpA/Prc